MCPCPGKALQCSKARPASLAVPAQIRIVLTDVEPAPSLNSDNHSHEILCAKIGNVAHAYIQNCVLCKGKALSPQRLPNMGTKIPDTPKYAL